MTLGSLYGWHIVQVQFKHEYGSQQGVVLSEGVVSSKIPVKYQADLFGISTATVQEMTEVGVAVASAITED